MVLVQSISKLFGGRGIVLSKLALKFVIVVFCALFLSAVLFATLYMGRFHVFRTFINKEYTLAFTDKAVNEIQTYVENEALTVSEAAELESIMQKYTNLSMLLYDEQGISYADYVSEKEDIVYAETTYFLLALYIPEPSIYRVEFADGTLQLLVYSYVGTSFLLVYLVLSLIVSVLLFLGIIIRFVHRKMRYVLMLKDELTIMEHNDLTHAIPYKGNDELTMLAKQLNSLRKTLQNNILREKKAKKANYDLVTAMSHDLRTPLTSLLGYLDILDMKIYKNEEEQALYIKKSHQKALQIKELSDRLFQHFLVYAQTEDIKLTEFSHEYVNGLILCACEELREYGFALNMHISEETYVIWAQEVFLNRTMDNLISNIKKYGDHQVEVSIEVANNYIEVRFVNDIRKVALQEESTKIGLYSVKMMMEMLQGELFYESKHDAFEVRLVFCKYLENH